MEMISRGKEVIRRENYIVRPLVQDPTLRRFSWPPRTESFWCWWNLAGDSRLCSQGGALQQSSLSCTSPLPKKCVSIICFAWLMPDKRAPRVNAKHSSSQAPAPCCAGLGIELLRGAFGVSLEIAIADDWTNEESNMNFLIEGQGLCWELPSPSTLRYCKASESAATDYIYLSLSLWVAPRSW